MPLARKRHITFAILCFLLAFGANFTPEAQASQPPPQDVVILVDCSKSTSPYISSIVGILERFVTGANYGDSFTCYQFSNQPLFFAGKKIEKVGDIAQLKSQIGQLRSVNKYTNYPPAIERAMEHIRAFHGERPASEKVLLIITDGRRHKEDTLSEKNAFQQLLEKYAGLKTGTDYFLYCFFIGDRIEKDLESYFRSAGGYFVRWPAKKEWLNNLALVDVRVMDEIISLGRVSEASTHSSFTIDFHPRRPPTQISMMEFSMRAEFAEKTLDRFFDVNPRRFMCRQRPWKEKFDLEIRGFEKGDYSGTFTFQPSEPHILLLAPRTIGFRFSVLEPLYVHVPTPLNFGPTDFGEEYEETKKIFITTTGADFPDSGDAISVKSDIVLPEGIQLDLQTDLGQREITVNITVSRPQAISRKAKGEYEGTIRLAVHAGWALSTEAIPVSVQVMKSERDLRKIYYYILAVAVFILIISLTLLASNRNRTAIKEYFAGKDRPIGKLVVTGDPTRGLAKNINLDRLSETERIKEILVGTGKGSHVDLPHRSMMDKRYMFSGTKTRDVVHTFVQAVEGTDEVIVNNISRTGQIQLRHLDTIKLGAFEFRYEVPRPLHQAVLYFLNGDVWQGWILSWNIETDGFQFLKRDDLPDRKESYVRFYELKAVAFVRDFDGELTKRLLRIKTPRSGHRMRIVFADQEELTGYILDWRDPGNKFYFFPDSMGDNILFFLIERHTVKEMAVLEDDARGAEWGRRQLDRVLEKMREESATQHF